MKNLAQSIGSNLMGSVENLDYVENGSTYNIGTNRDSKLNQSSKH